MPGWLTPEAVAEHADVAGPSPGSVPLANVTAAAERWVETTARPDLTYPVDAEDQDHPVPADVKLGALMLAWRWYERRNTQLGLVTSSTGDPVEMLRDDPDIAKLLGVGRAGKFRFGSTPRPAGPSGVVTL